MSIIRTLYKICEQYTINRERFTGGKLLWIPLNETQRLMFKTLKQHHYTKFVYIHGKTFVVLLKTESLVQQIFPRLRYSELRNFTKLCRLVGSCGRGD